MAPKKTEKKRPGPVPKQKPVDVSTWALHEFSNTLKQKAKVKAAQQGLSLKAFAARAIEQAVSQ